MENEILEVEFELGNGEKQSMKIQECEDWSEIDKGTKALMTLINNQTMLVEIDSACENEGVSFSIVGEKRLYHHEANVVSSIYTEVKLRIVFDELINKIK